MIKQELNDSITQFAKGNKDLEKILALFSAQVITMISKHYTEKVITLNEELLDLTKGLINFFDINTK